MSCEGSPPLTFQWLSNSVAIVGATSPTYTLDRAPLSANGTKYNCTVTNPFGSTTSQVATLTVSARGQPMTIVLGDFSDASNLRMSGTAAKGVTSDGHVLELTPAATNCAGAAFWNIPFPIASMASFNSLFSFKLNWSGGSPDADGAQGADGIVFVIQGFPNPVGCGGGGLGYRGLPNSVGIEYDTWHNLEEFGQDPDSNHIGIDVDGNQASLVTVPISDPMNNGQVWYSWIEYAGELNRLEVRIAKTPVRPAAAALVQTIDLGSILGTTEAYFGFTGATGGAFNQQDILSWRLSLTEGAIPQGSLSNLRASQRPGTTLVDLYYDFRGVSTIYGISAAVSSDRGTSFTVPATHFTGDGLTIEVPAGTNRHIVWDAGVDLPGLFSTKMRLKLAVTGAEANTISPIFVLDTRTLPTGSLTGLVGSGGNALANAQVQIDGTGFDANTGADGRFTLGNVPVGSGYLLKVSAAGFAPSSISNVRVTTSSRDLGVIMLHPLGACVFRRISDTVPT